MDYSRKKKTSKGLEGGLNLPIHPTPPPAPSPTPEFLVFTLLETPQNFVRTPLGDFKT